MNKFTDCFDVIGRLLTDLNLNLEDDVDICLTTDADEDGHHNPSLTIVDIETRESLLTVVWRIIVSASSVCCFQQSMCYFGR